MIAARRASRDALRVELSLVTPVVGAIAAVPVFGLFALGLALGSVRAAITMAIGANLIVVVSLIGGLRLPIAVALLDALGLGVAAFLGSVTGPLPWLHVATMVAWCFAAGLLVALGQVQGVVGTQSVIAFVVLGRFAGPPAAAAQVALFVVVGALAGACSLLVLRLPPSLRHQRSLVAGAFDSLAEFARSEPRRPAAGAATRADAAEAMLSTPVLFGRDDTAVLRSILDEARRARVELSTLAGLRARLGEPGPGVLGDAADGAMADAAVALRAIADRLRHPRDLPRWRSAVAEFRAALATFERRGEVAADGRTLVATQCVAHLVALEGQLRAAGALVERALAEVGRRRLLSRLPTPRGIDLEQLSSDVDVLTGSLHADNPSFRHAVRFAVAVPLSFLAAEALDLPRPYWVPFAVAVILKPDFSSLFGRGLGRVLGTVAGASLAALLVGALHPGEAVTVVFVALAAWAAYSCWSASFPIAIGLVTAVVLMLLSVSQPDSAITALDRLVDTVLGGAIALVSYLCWPTPPGRDVAASESALFTAQRAYLRVAFRLVAGEELERADVAPVARDARIAWSRAEAAVGRAIQEPRADQRALRRDQGLLAAALRIVRAGHALRTEAQRGAVAPSSPELVALADALDRQLAAVAECLAGQLPSDALAPLRPLFQAAADEILAGGGPESIALHLDELVDAANTAAHLLSLLPEPAAG